MSDKGRPEEQGGDSGEEERIHALDADDPAAALLRGLREFIRHESHDLSLRQMAVLILCVDARESQTVGAIARHLQIRQPPVSRAIDHLERAELVKRKTNPKDGRGIWVLPTPRGRRLCTQFSLWQ